MKKTRKINMIGCILNILITVVVVITIIGLYYMAQVKILNKDYIYLYLDNRYEFASDINTKERKEQTIINNTISFLNNHNLSFDKRVYFVSNGTVIGYINKRNLK